MRSNTNILAKNPFQKLSYIAWRDIVYKTAIFATGGMLLFFTILLKSKTTSNFETEPYFFSYAIFVTTFMLSRIIAAMFFEKSLDSLIKESDRASDNDDCPEPKVAFIIPCKNEEDNIEDSIVQCFKADYPQEKLEVIVINDGSTDNTQEVLERMQKKFSNLSIILWKENKGKRQAMAAGFMKTNAEIVVQLDSDSYIDPKTFRHLITPFKNSKVAAVCASGLPKNADKNILTKMQSAYYLMSFRILKAAESTYDTVFCCSGCCSAYRRRDVLDVLQQWLAEEFLGLPVTWGDDRALTSWLLKKGKKTVFSHKAVAYTVVPETLKKLLVQQLRWKKSWIVNFFFTSRFIFSIQPFVAAFYYFPLILISFLTPLMTFRALIYNPITKGVFPAYHIIGILLLTSILALYYRYLEKDDKYWPYLFLWSLFNLFLLSFVLVWAALRIQDRGWGTR